jgi:tRNA modification GTPase
MNDVDRRLLDWSSSATRVVVASKCDRPPKWQMAEAIRVSTLRNTGLSELRCAMLASLTQGQSLKDPAPVSNLRHVLLLKEARGLLIRARAALKEQGAPEEFVLVDLQRARASLGEVVGVGSPEETLDYIFSRFCVGK